jgi:hypothetical protein
MADNLGLDGGAVDLFGNAVRVTRRGRGRPAHVASPENRQKVILWLAVGHSDDDIAEAFGITTKTLVKYYFHELAYRRTARMEIEARNLAAIVEQVDKGNAAAMSLLDKKLERWRIGASPKVNRPAKPAKLGKKEQQMIDARNAGADSSWDSLLTQH